MKFSPLISELIEAFTCLLGVRRKSAQRMAFHLLERHRDGALELSKVLHNAMEHIIIVSNAVRLLNPLFVRSVLIHRAKIARIDGVRYTLNFI